ncbi:MAG: hypothetical protein IK111_05635 [Lachnospiraceae bacterium]|nr:hypothetical protein [Lachnospiraceae bacterium]MBR6487071.1 hypothetical protein [Lachnospiraceae bacterium]
MTSRMFMKLGEISGIILTASLLRNMVNASTFMIAVSVISGILFVGSVLAIQLQRYEKELEERGYQIQ